MAPYCGQRFCHTTPLKPRISIVSSRFSKFPRPFRSSLAVQSSSTTTLPCPSSHQRWCRPWRSVFTAFCTSYGSGTGILTPAPKPTEAQTPKSPPNFLPLLHREETSAPGRLKPNCLVHAGLPLARHEIAPSLPSLSRHCHSPSDYKERVLRDVPIPLPLFGRCKSSFTSSERNTPPPPPWKATIESPATKRERASLGAKACRLPLASRPSWLWASSAQALTPNVLQN